MDEFGPKKRLDAEKQTVRFPPLADIRLDASINPTQGSQIDSLWEGMWENKQVISTIL